MTDWTTLFRIACNHIEQANSEQIIVDHWTFGGGTAMMLQIDHRESHDVDIFLADAQLLGFLDPAKHDFHFEIMPADYQGDGARFLKLSFKDIGEIDYIVGDALTAEPTTKQTVERKAVLLETIPEIITKKIYHRGGTIKPRDIFDVAAGGVNHADTIIEALRMYPDKVAEAVAKIDSLKPDFVNGAIRALAIKDTFKTVAETAIERTKEILRAV